MHIHLSINNFYGQSLFSQQTTYSPELMHLLKQFFESSEQRNNALKLLLEKLENEPEPNKRYVLMQELSNCQQENELDIELVKKLLP